ncbi:hypothetical protein [Motiliproteus sp.]|uniref:hypothetical protein n=1 Tax=Motiliproteus sp. TaxID=1898955 RepID=UPI003BAB0856
MKPIANTTDHSFNLGFEVEIDLTGFTELRFGLRRPDSNSYHFRTLPPSSWNELQAGDVLDVLIEPGDFTVPGRYKCQVFGREVRDGTEVRSRSSEPVSFEVGGVIAPDPWALD